jgi:hypothetical protein
MNQIASMRSRDDDLIEWQFVEDYSNSQACIDQVRALGLKSQGLT